MANTNDNLIISFVTLLGALGAVALDEWFVFGNSGYQIRPGGVLVFDEATENYNHVSFSEARTRVLHDHWTVATAFEQYCDLGGNLVEETHHEAHVALVEQFPVYARAPRVLAHFRKAVTTCPPTA